MRIAGRRRGPIAFWALAGAALFASHDAVYLAQVGPGERLTAALRSGGHGYWAAASLLLVAIAALAAAFALLRITRLRRRAAALGAVRARDVGLRRVVPIWGRLAAVVVIGFAIQENGEHLLAHGHLIGGGALVGPEYPLALPVLSLVSLVGAVVAALLTASEHALITAIAAALAIRPRPRRAGGRPPQRLPTPAASVLARFLAGRAPPSPLRTPSAT